MPPHPGFPGLAASSALAHSGVLGLPASSVLARTSWLDLATLGGLARPGWRDSARAILASGDPGRLDWLNLIASSVLTRPDWLDLSASSIPRSSWLARLGYLGHPGTPLRDRSGDLKRPGRTVCLNSTILNGLARPGRLDLAASAEPGCLGRRDSLWQARFGWLSPKASTLSLSALLASFMLHRSASI